MNNVFVYLEIEDGTVAEVSLELLTKGRTLASQLGCRLEAIAAGASIFLKTNACRHILPCRTHPSW